MTDTHEKRRASDFEPQARVFTTKQMFAVLAFIATAQAVGGKFVIDSYIDARVGVHDRNPNAHAGIMAQKVDAQKDGEEVRRQFQTVNEKLDATNQRLSRIEGALQARGR